MQRLKMIRLAILATITLGATTTATATAGTTSLPEFSPETGATSTSGTGSLKLEGTLIPCASAAGTFGAGPKLGTFVLTFTNCISGGKGCKSLGGTSGVIVVKGTWHLVSLWPWRTHYLLWLLISPSAQTEPVHIECEAAVIGLVTVWGDLLG